MSLYKCCGIPWEVPQKISEFSNSQKMPFRTVNYPNLRWESPKNSPGDGKISLKIRIASFMLISFLNKFQVIPIVKSAQTCKIPQQLAKFKDYSGVDVGIGSIRKWNEVTDRSFLTPPFLLKNLG